MIARATPWSERSEMKRGAPIAEIHDHPKVACTSAKVGWIKIQASIQTVATVGLAAVLLWTNCRPCKINP
jgi:hypothetical protein